MTKQIIVFKNNMPNLTVLKVFSDDFETVKEKLKKKLKQAPMMFIGMQLIVDLSAFDKEEELLLDVPALIAFLQGEGINPVALMSDRVSFRNELVKTKLGVLPVLRNKNERPTALDKAQEAEDDEDEALDSEADSAEEEQEKEKDNEEPRKTFEDEDSNKEDIHPENVTLRHPVRSGQRFYTKGDLTVIGFVSPGAEVIAEGNIHIYGKLSGRAIAGAQGDTSASIFCRKLDAELVSIAGNYKQIEDIEEEFINKPVQISLEDEKICFFSL